MRLHEIANNPGVVVRPALITALLLLGPFMGVIFGDWAWGWPPFVVFGSIIFSAGFAYELVGKRTRAGSIGGFVFGLVAGVLTIGTLRYLHPEEDIAGIVIITLLFFSIFFAIVGHLIQRSARRARGDL